MFSFLEAIFIKIISVVTSVIIAVGLVSAPTPQLEPSPQMEGIVEVKQDVKELEKINLEAELEQVKAEASKAKAESAKTQRATETITRKLSEEKLKKQQEEQARQLEQQKTKEELIRQDWLDLESKSFVEANQKGWTYMTITNTYGEKRYYRKEGDLWVKKNSEAEARAEQSSPLSRLKNCMEKAIETARAIGGEPATYLSDCLGTSPTSSYSAPSPNYSSPAPSSQSVLDTFNKMEQERRLKELEQKQWQMEQDQKKRENEEFLDCIMSGRVPCL